MSVKHIRWHLSIVSRSSHDMTSLSWHCHVSLLCAARLWYFSSIVWPYRSRITIDRFSFTESLKSVVVVDCTRVMHIIIYFPIQSNVLYATTDMMYVVTNLFKELLNFKIRIVLQAYRTTHSIKHQVNETALAKLQPPPPWTIQVTIIFPT